MIEVRIIATEVISGYNKVDESIQEANRSIEIFFYKNICKFPCIPKKGMMVNLLQFSDGLDENSIEWLQDCNSTHKIKDVVICKGYLEVYLER